MGLARVLTCALLGLDGHLVEVEVDIAHGLFKMELVGRLPPDRSLVQERPFSAPHHTVGQAELAQARPGALSSAMEMMS